VTAKLCQFLERSLERDLLPDWLIRIGIRRLLVQRLRSEDLGTPDLQQAHLMAFVQRLKEAPIAIETASANAQHYEIPTRFLNCLLGNI